MTTPNTKNDIMSLPEPERSEWLQRLAASILVRGANNEIVESTGTIERFGFVRGDFAEAGELPQPPLIVPVEPGEEQSEQPTGAEVTAEQFLAASGFPAMRLLGLKDLEEKLVAAGRMSPKLEANRAWISGVLGLYATGLRPRSDWPEPPHRFEEVFQEAAFVLGAE
jgi:hypothetical protein